VEKEKKVRSAFLRRDGKRGKSAVIFTYVSDFIPPLLQEALKALFRCFFRESGI
jgi:hypothetical protein